ncbi:unnamed protein product [Cuscuta epithymum]|uniref:Uncharacterized protein n=2 Tax=Cuscuta epithymum TaxID=186058 RepID=A0AAV0FU95_9ASTE|nr:unnamed protein product [Cuscuta epithymum]
MRMRSRVVALLWITFLVCFVLLNCFSEARHHPSAAILVGVVHCDTCFHQHSSKSSHIIAGASVAVECGDTRKGPSFFEGEVKTDEKGEFRVNLPLSVSEHVKKNKGFCSVKLISSSSDSKPHCAATASAASSSSIHFKEKREGKHIFSAGSFTLKPQLCDQKQRIHGKKTKTSVAESHVAHPNLELLQVPVGPGIPVGGQDISGKKTSTAFLPPTRNSLPATPIIPTAPVSLGNPVSPPTAHQDGTSSPPIQGSSPRVFLPPVMQGGFIVPMPEIPPIPPIPKIPFMPSIPGFPPSSKKSDSLKSSERQTQASDEKTVQPATFTPIIRGLPTNPLLPLPSNLPNPIQSPPLIPSPPPLQQPFPFLPSPFIPSFPTPFPQFPFPTTPTFPGVPPAAASYTQKKNLP